MSKAAVLWRLWMNEKMTFFKYFLLENSIAMRTLVFKEDGIKAGAQVPGNSTGRLIANHSYLIKAETTWEIEEIEKNHFEHCYAAIYARPIKG